MCKFSERLRDLRIDYGYNQDEIASKLNVTTSGYGYYEQGRNEPSLETIKNMAHIFQVSTDYLLGLIDTPNHPVYYSITEDLSLNESEIDTLKKMKQLHLLREVSQQPNENVKRLHRYWEFIKSEQELNNH
ncbi:helix-turn-helix domain-containing protein [Virgibacillus sp. NKC19-3]|uniref:helix-turn-helix domain-containing protein n=1 Tax=Virgibacillus saliphilus TaxID=2831674 RepID=UPI001C9B0DD4|nr:helix-turn-helix domain-containing protein [Virgibacillus sp. NKC19-3]MBY7144503.1 helix-turn-helix domain-containing protein [Virgibacillus sp. NKC19-3]